MLCNLHNIFSKSISKNRIKIRINDLQAMDDVETRSLDTFLEHSTEYLLS